MPFHLFRRFSQLQNEVVGKEQISQSGSGQALSPHALLLSLPVF